MLGCASSFKKLKTTTFIHQTYPTIEYQWEFLSHWVCQLVPVLDYLWTSTNSCGGMGQYFTSHDQSIITFFFYARKWVALQNVHGATLCNERETTNTDPQPVINSCWYSGTHMMKMSAFSCLLLISCSRIIWFNSLNHEYIKCYKAKALYLYFFQR